jgi:uncharacterized protein
MATSFSPDPRSPDRHPLPLGRERTENLLKIVAGYCDQQGGCHGPDHTLRVHRMALEIGAAMGADLEVLSAAALLHDVGRRDETRSLGVICHAGRGAELARVILADFHFPAPAIEKIVHCIAAHRYRGSEAPVSIEARILFDADKLDSIGAIGIGRAFLFAGQIGARLHNEPGMVEDAEAYSIDDTAYREFKVKMSKIKDRLLTPGGRKLAQERHRFMEIFFARLEEEINLEPASLAGSSENPRGLAQPADHIAGSEAVGES